MGGRRVCAVTRGFMVIIFEWLCNRERTWARVMWGGTGVRVRVWWVVVRTVWSEVSISFVGMVDEGAMRRYRKIRYLRDIMPLSN